MGSIKTGYDLSFEESQSVGIVMSSLVLVFWKERVVQTKLSSQANGSGSVKSAFPLRLKESVISSPGDWVSMKVSFSFLGRNWYWRESVSVIV